MTGQRKDCSARPATISEQLARWGENYDVGRWLGVPRTTVRGWRKGRRRPPTAVLRLLDLMDRIEVAAPALYAVLRPPVVPRPPLPREPDPLWEDWFSLRLVLTQKRLALNDSKLARYLGCSSPSIAIWRTGVTARPLTRRLLYVLNIVEALMPALHDELLTEWAYRRHRTV